MMRRYVLSIIFVLAAWPVWAGERVYPVSDELNVDEPFEHATIRSMLRSLLDRAFDVIEDHVELKSTLQPNEKTGERRGRVQLKLYPHGKSNSDDSMTAELRFRSSPHVQHFSFDLKLPKEPQNSFTFPDNTL
jgi:hypothetical protein